VGSQAVPSVDTDLCREHLDALLAEEIVALRDLEDLLKREHEVLSARTSRQLNGRARRQQMMGDWRARRSNAAPYAPCTAKRPTGLASRV